MTSQTATSSHEGLLRALDQTSFRPAAWNDVCQRLADIAGGVGTVIIPVSVEARQSGMPVSESIGGLVQDYVSGGWHQTDARERGIHKLFSQGVYSDLDYTTESEIDRDPFYQDFLRHHGVQWFTGLGLRLNGGVWCAAVQGATSKGPFQREAGQRLLQVRHLVELSARRSAALGFDRLANWQDAFESAGRAVLAVDRFGTVRRASPSAENLLVGALQLRNGRLRAADFLVDSRLQALVAAALAFDPWRSRPMPGPISVPRVRATSIVVDAFPMPRDYQTLLTDVSALVVMREAEPPSISRELKSEFGLTDREVEVVLVVARERNVRTVADLLNISEKTVRTHLHTIFAKTDMKKQADLVALVSRLTSG